MTNNDTTPRRSASTFSREVPKLLSEHLVHLRDSAISIEVIRERGYRSVLGKKELADLGFSWRQQRVPGILIPLHGVDGTSAGYQYRPDNPRMNPKGKPIKYENPQGTCLCLDVPPRCSLMLEDPAVPLWITEGAKKADALATQGTCAINLNGIWGWRGTNPKGGKVALPDWEMIALNRRKIYLIPDSDAKTNTNVNQAVLRLGAFLMRRGGKCFLVELPHGEGDEDSQS